MGCFSFRAAEIRESLFSPRNHWSSRWNREEETLAPEETKVFQSFSNEGATLELTLEIVRVEDLKRGSIFDGMETCEYDDDVVSPGTTVKVRNEDKAA